MATYIERAIDAAHEAMPGEDPDLIRLYTLLALVKGEDTTMRDVHDEDTTMRDVHDAWSLWRTASRPDHPSIVPFDQLTTEVQEYDRPYMHGIHTAAKETTA